MPALVARFQTDWECIDRRFSIRISSQRRHYVSSFFAAWRKTLQDLALDDLSRNDQLDVLLMSKLIDQQISKEQQDHARYDAVLPLAPFAPALVALDEARRDLCDIDPKSAANEIDKIHAQLLATRHDLEGGVLAAVPRDLQRTADIVADLSALLAAWFDFSHGYSPLFTWWVERPYRNLALALADYQAVLRKAPQCADSLAVSEDPLGRDALVEALSRERISYTPEELIEFGRAEMEWCRAELIRASREMGCGDNWHEALERVKDGFEDPGDQPALVRDLALEAISYVRDHDLVTVPSIACDFWQMEMMPPERQKINPFFLGGEKIIVSFPTDEMDHQQKMMSLRGNNRAYSRATVFHELIPGHHLQMYAQDRYRAYRKIFNTPFWIEGWTLHWELLLWELGFAKTPQDRIGMLFWRMHRGARVVFSLGYHCGKITAQQCVEMLVADVGHERANAEAEVRRSFGGEYDPLYQCAYLIGGKQVHSLYHSMVDGKKMTSCQFHDIMLRENCMPIGLLRTLVTGKQFADSSCDNWRFLE
jgi:hypothetical protein